MLIDYALSQTSIVLRVKLRQDTTGTAPGNGITALTSSSSGLIISTIADNEATPTTYTQSGSTIEAVSTLGTFAAPTATKCRFKKVDDTNHPGVYEIQIADARFAVSSSKSLLISISGVSGMSNCDVCIPLRSINPYDGTRGGMTALPNAAANANGGLPILSVSGTTLGYTITTLTTYTGNMVQTGDSFARIGALGAGLTAVVLGSTQTFSNTGTWTGNIVGTLSTLTTYAGNTPQTGDVYALANGVSGFVATKGDTAAIKLKTDNLPVSPAAVGSLMGLADGAITDAKVTIPAEAAGRPTTMLGALRRAWEWAVNKRTRSRTTGDVVLFGADNTTVLETQTQSTVGSTDTQSKGA